MVLQNLPRRKRSIKGSYWPRGTGQSLVTPAELSAGWAAPSPGGALTLAVSLASMAVAIVAGFLLAAGRAVRAAARTVARDGLHRSDARHPTS